MTVSSHFSNRLLAGVLAVASAGTLIGCSFGPKQTPIAAASGPMWRVNNGASELRFVTTKNTNVAETQKFTRIDGVIAADGGVSLVVDLASVETQVPIRNERMQNLLFEVVRFPTANFETSIDLTSAGPPGDP